MINRRDTRISVEYDPSARAFPLYVWARDLQADTVYGAQPLVMEPVTEGQADRPVTYLSLEAANQLMDDLWRAGARPTNVRNQSELIDAKEKHIEDLRSIATKLLDKVIGA